MCSIRVGKESSTQIQIHYEDLGSGQPVVLIPGGLHAESPLRKRAFR